jgi:hypothetical protein
VPGPEPQGVAAGADPIGILTVDDSRCVDLARRLALAIAGGSDGCDAAVCGRPADLPRGVTALPAAAFRPPRPFSGPLFAAVEAAAMAARLAAAPADARCLALVVPLLPLGNGGEGESPDQPAMPGHDALSAARVVVVADHVNLALRGPLTGRWPAGRPRTFPALNGVYAPAVAERLLQAAAAVEADTSTTAGRQREPEDGRSAAGAAVYSRLVVAGVADSGRQTVFETDQARAAGLSWASSCLVAPVVVAAYYGLVVAAVGVPGGR